MFTAHETLSCSASFTAAMKPTPDFQTHLGRYASQRGHQAAIYTDNKLHLCCFVGDKFFFANRYRESLTKLSACLHNASAFNQPRTLDITITHNQVTKNPQQVITSFCLHIRPSPCLTLFPHQKRLQPVFQHISDCPRRFPSN